MRAARLVVRERRGAEQARELARGGAARHVHLEETFLRMDVAERTCRVEAIGRPHDDGAARVALDGRRQGQAVEADRAV